MRAVHTLGLLLFAMPLMGSSCGEETFGGVCLDSAFCEDTYCPDQTQCGDREVLDAFCDPDDPSGEPRCVCECGSLTCDAIYGDVQGYSRCQQTETTCRFYRNSKPDEISCYEICGTEGDCTQWEEGDPNLCDVGTDGSSCDEPLGDGVCECERKQPDGGTGGSGGGNGARTLEDRCDQSDDFYCGNGHACQEEGWNLDPLIFDDLYGESVLDCKSKSRPCTTEEAYCEDRSFEGTYNAANHEACISGQDPEVWSCTLDEFGFPVFPPECDQICATSPD